MDDNEWEYSLPAKFERITNAVEAFRITYDSVKACADWCGGEALKVVPPVQGYIKRNIDQDENPILRVPTLEGVIVGFNDDWVIKDEKGRFSVMTAKDFKKEFQVVKAKIVTVNNVE